MRLIILGLIVAMTGCTLASKTYGPDGREAYTINCSGTLMNWGMCYEKAGDLCGSRGYDVLSQNGEDGVIYTATQSNAVGGSTGRRSMLISCR